MSKMSRMGMMEITRLRRTGSALALAAVLLAAPAPGFARDRYDDDRGRGDDRYVFATTRGLTDMDIHPALKIPALPLAIILDIVFFPIALLADLAT